MTIIEAPDSGVLEAKVAIVGSGAGALAIAGELSRLGIETLVIEAGPVRSTPPASHRRNVLTELESFNAELRSLLLPHANGSEPVPGLPGGAGIHGVGGMMTHWANAVPRPQPLEWAGPIAFPELEALLDDADAIVGSIDGLYGEGSLRQQWIRDKVSAHFGRDLVRPNRVAARKTGDGKFHLTGGDTLVERGLAAIRILPDTIVQQVHSSGGRASRLSAVSTNGKALQIEADVFVVAAGIIGTPQLLHASGIDELPALGRYLTDHLNLVTRVLLQTENAPADSPDDPPLGLYFPVAEGRPFHASILDIPSSAHAGILAGCDDMRTTDVGIFLGTEPDAANRLIFDHGTPDALGLPSVSANLRLTDLDHANVRQALAWQYEVVRSIGEPWRGMTPMFRPFGSSLHLMGTFRMGDDAEVSVTDARSKVWGFDNLYLAGNGILGSRNSCNPTLTTIALALLAARAIAKAA